MKFEIVPKPKTFTGTSKYQDLLEAYVVLKPGQSIVVDISGDDGVRVLSTLRTTIFKKKLVRPSFRFIGQKLYIFQNPKATKKGGAK